MVNGRLMSKVCFIRNILQKWCCVIIRVFLNRIKVLSFYLIGSCISEVFFNEINYLSKYGNFMF